MKLFYRFLIYVLVSLVLAVGAYLWATGMVNSLFAYRSPLKDNPPSAGEKLGPLATRRLVFVLVDALRYDTTQNSAVMPIVAELRQKGVSAKMHRGQA